VSGAGWSWGTPVTVATAAGTVTASGMNAELSERPDGAWLLTAVRGASERLISRELALDGTGAWTTS
jgi:hypothetical protein